MTLDDLICKTECQELIFRHARHLDEGEFDESTKTYTDDARMITPTGQEARIRDMDQAVMRRSTLNLKPRIVTNVVITPTGPDTAEGFCYITLPRKLVAQGEWHYKFRKTAQGWRVYWFKALGLEREKGELEMLAKEARERAAAQKSAGQ